MKNKKNLFITILCFLMISTSLASINLINVNASTSFDPTPDPPNNNVYWDFDEGDIIGWNLVVYNGSNYMMEMDLIYNISAITYFENFSGHDVDYHGVQLTQMYFNVTTSSLEKYTDYPLFNHSLVNFTSGSGDFIAYALDQNSYLGPNPFIPTNGSNGLMLQWCGDRSNDDYFFLLGGDMAGDVTYPDTNTIRIDNSTGSGEYIEMKYYPNGTLEEGSVFTYQGEMFPEGVTYNYTRIYDFNPLDDLEWSVDIGDVFYIGMMGGEFKYEIVDFINSSVDFMMGPLAVQEVRANISYWDFFSESWEYDDDNVTIGVANEQYPLVMSESLQGPPLIVPIGTRGKDIAKSHSYFTSWYPELEITYGDYWMKMVNTTSEGYSYMEFFPNGLMKYMIYKQLMSPEDVVLFYKNSTVINGAYDFEIEPYGTDEFYVNVNISVSDDTHLLYAGMDQNPVNVTLNDGLLFIDLFLNETNNLDGLINITIDYNVLKYNNINTWWFNMSADEGNGAWEEIPYTYLGVGKLEVSVNHTSFFALTGTSFPGPFILSTNASDPDTNGIFKLTWGISEAAVDYSIYSSNSTITVITGSETLIAAGVTALEYTITETINGIYYYVVVANNALGQALSNYIDVTVSIPPSGDFVLSSNAGAPDTDGNFTLTWTSSNRANNYSVYLYSSYITEINGSLTILINETGALTLPLTGYTNGTYYFIVVAHNDYGDTLSNCIYITVAISPPEPEPEPTIPEIPGYELIYVIMLISVISIITIIKKRRKINNI
jgi:hypothetical protein